MRLLLVLIASALFAAPVQRGTAPAGPLPASTPEKEGFSSTRLERLHGLAAQLVNKGERSGVITLVARNGRLVDLRSWGLRDVEAKLPMEKNTICRIYSMSKIITSVAALALYEEGKFDLTDPVEMYIPEMKGMKVLEGGTADDPYLVPAKSPITIKQLFTHTSGLMYGWERTEAGEIWRRSKLFEAPTLRDVVSRVGGLPLAFHPGERFLYGVNTDVLGYLVEVTSGMPLDKFVEQRILAPLGMKDTSYFLSAEKKARAAKVYVLKDGKLEAQKDPEYKWPSGGGGMWSTIGDYARFGQMLLNGGQLDGVRILSRKTVELMEANHLNHIGDGGLPGGSHGFGLGGSVRLDLAKGNSLGTVGEFGWAGAASTWFRIDPKERLMILLFQQHMPADEKLARKFADRIYQAIVD